MSFYQWQDRDLLISCRVQPHASKDEFAVIQGDLLKIRIKAPPVDGKANQHLIMFLAKQFKVPKNRIRLVSGAAHRNKRILVNNPGQLPQSIPELSLP